MTNDTATLEQSLNQTTSAFTLTSDQAKALESILAFLMSPVEHVFVLSGYSGCGKSTLVRTLLDRLPGYQKAIKLVMPNSPEYEPLLTATTNKAAENLGHLTGYPVATVQSALGLRVETDFKTNTSKLVPKRGYQNLEHMLLLIDEASYVDSELLGHVFTRTNHCKVIFIGDPAQLTPVKSNKAPVFEASFPGAQLSQVVRQAEGNPIVELSTKFRHLVNTGEYFSFKPDGHHIRHMNRDDFSAAIEAEFTRPGWKYADSKILAWTNKCVVGYNQFVSNLAKGDPHFQPGDYAVCNSFFAMGKNTLKTDEMVQITAISEDTTVHGVLGNYMTIDHTFDAFQPKSLAEQAARLRQARVEDDYAVMNAIETTWIDLRGAFACTINKSQGSTFDSVFIDLDDVGRCNSGNQIARMLYVGVSRAKHHVYLTGDWA